MGRWIVPTSDGENDVVVSLGPARDGFRCLVVGELAVVRAVSVVCGHSQTSWAAALHVPCRYLGRIYFV